MRVELAQAPDMPEVYALRHQVFILEQAVPEDTERDELDDTCVHAVARADGGVVGTGRLLAPVAVGAAAAIGRMAVAEHARGVGIGSAVLALLEDTALAAGWPVVELHAQVHARGFYERAGYEAYGEPYLEAGIEHISMRKHLAPR